MRPRFDFRPPDPRFSHVEDTPQRLGPYQVRSKIGTGGMGVVYLGWDSRLNRHVALKTLWPELARDVQCRARFLQEARAAAALSHPNLTQIYDIGEEEGQVYFATCGASRGVVHCVGLQGGERRWVWEAPEESEVIRWSPTVSGGSLYVVAGFRGDLMYCLDTNDGTVKWRTSLLDPQDLGGTRTKLNLGGSPATNGRRVLVGSLDGAVRALDPKDGRVCWSTHLNAMIECSPAVVRNALYVGTDRGEFVALSPEDGAPGVVTGR